MTKRMKLTAGAALLALSMLTGAGDEPGAKTNVNVWNAEGGETSVKAAAVLRGYALVQAERIVGTAGEDPVRAAAAVDADQAQIGRVPCDDDAHG